MRAQPPAPRPSFTNLHFWYANEAVELSGVSYLRRYTVGPGFDFSLNFVFAWMQQAALSTFRFGRVSIGVSVRNRATEQKAGIWC
jgi:hypothetical protein